MRAFFLVALVGCSAPEDAAFTDAASDAVTLGDAARDTRADTNAAMDTAVDTRIDTASVDTAADTSPGDGCVPMAKSTACAPPPGSTAEWCGKVDDGCGGKATCDPCSSPKLCMNGPGPGFGERGVCSCGGTVSGACKTTSGAAGTIHECGSSGVPMDPECAKWKVLVGGITEWCCPP